MANWHRGVLGFTGVFSSPIDFLNGKLSFCCAVLAGFLMRLIGLALARQMTFPGGYDVFNPIITIRDAVLRPTVFVGGS